MEVCLCLFATVQLMHSQMVCAGSTQNDTIVVATAWCIGTQSCCLRCLRMVTSSGQYAECVGLH
jgi:hypothetical protein